MIAPHHDLLAPLVARHDAAVRAAEEAAHLYVLAERACRCCDASLPELLRCRATEEARRAARLWDEPTFSQAA